MSVLLAPSPLGLPGMLHWGPDLGEVPAADLAAYLPLRAPGVPHSALDEPRYASVVPENPCGFTGTPAVEGHRLPADGPLGPRSGAWAPRFLHWHWEVTEVSVALTSADTEAGLSVRWELELTEEGLIRARTAVTNTVADPLVVSAVRTVLPVAAEATELIDLTGRWCRERTPQRHPWVQGTWSRSGRHGRTGHDATLLMLAGTPASTSAPGTCGG